MSSGKVFLVGAGPGDPSLITVRGLQLIREADVILYDALASKELLDEARADCRILYVGKRRGSQSISQEAINAHLVKLAQKGKRVVRLKGGDPYIFGRGGEEALACIVAGVEVEVVPGVTSAVAVPGCAGIPVLHRALAGSVLIFHGRVPSDTASEVEGEAVGLRDEITEPLRPQASPDSSADSAGERREERRPGVVIRRRRKDVAPGALKVSGPPSPATVRNDADLPLLDDPGLLDTGFASEVAAVEEQSGRDVEIDWEAACKSADTLVILMGMARLDEIRSGLLAGGRPAAQPVAVTQWGTTPLQRTVVSTVDEFPTAVRKAGLANPAVIVVGEVINLRGELNTLEHKPLFGWKVAVADEGQGDRALVRALEDAGAQVVSAHCAHQTPLAATLGELNVLLANFRQATHVVFTDPSLVQTFIASARESRLDPMELLASCSVLAIGDEVARALADAGIRSKLVPRSIEDAAFAEALGKPFQSCHVVVVETEDDWGELADELEDAGATIANLVIYGPTPVQRGLDRLAHVLNRGEAHALVVATEGAATVLSKQWGKAVLGRLVPSLLLFARTEGIREILTAMDLTCAPPGHNESAEEFVVQLVAFRREMQSESTSHGALST